MSTTPGSPLRDTFSLLTHMMVDYPADTRFEEEVSPARPEHRRLVLLIAFIITLTLF